MPSDFMLSNLIINEFIDKVYSAKKALSLMLEYSSRLMDERLLKTAVDNIIMTCMYRYRKKLDEQNADMRLQISTDDTFGLATAMVDNGADRDSARNRARTLINSNYTIVTKDSDFCHDNVAGDLRPIIWYFAGIIGEDCLLRDAEFELSFSDELLAKMGESVEEEEQIDYTIKKEPQTLSSIFDGITFEQYNDDEGIHIEKEPQNLASLFEAYNIGNCINPRENAIKELKSRDIEEDESTIFTGAVKSADEFIELINKVKKTIEEIGDYPEKSEDLDNVRKNICVFMQTMMPEYAKTTLHYSYVEKREDVNKLAEMFTNKGASEGLAQTRAKIILNSDSSIVDSDKNFIDNAVADNIKEVARFYRDLLGQKAVNRGVRNVEFNLSDKLKEAMGFDEPKKEKDEETVAVEGFGNITPDNENASAEYNDMISEASDRLDKSEAMFGLRPETSIEDIPLLLELDDIKIHEIFGADEEDDDDFIDISLIEV